MKTPRDPETGERIRPRQPHLAVIFDAAEEVGRHDVTDIIESAIEKIPTELRLFPDLYAHRVTEALIKVGIVAPSANARYEYGVETQWGMEWGASVGMSHHYEYTAENVHSLASGRPVWRRLRTTTPDVLGEPERF